MRVCCRIDHESLYYKPNARSGLVACICVRSGGPTRTGQGRDRAARFRWPWPSLAMSLSQRSQSSTGAPSASSRRIPARIQTAPERTIPQTTHAALQRTPAPKEASRRRSNRPRMMLGQAKAVHTMKSRRPGDTPTPSHPRSHASSKPATQAPTALLRSASR